MSYMLYIFFYATFYSFSAKIITHTHTHTHTHTQYVVEFNLTETKVKFISDA